MKNYSDFGVYDFSDFAEELVGEALIRVNGGSCGGGFSGGGAGGGSGATGGSSSGGTSSGGNRGGSSGGTSGGGSSSGSGACSGGGSSSGGSSTGGHSGTSGTGNTGSQTTGTSGGTTTGSTPHAGGTTSTTGTCGGSSGGTSTSTTSGKTNSGTGSGYTVTGTKSEDNWTNHIPTQYKKAAEEYDQSQKNGKWMKNGGFKTPYSDTPINNGNEYVHNGEDYIYVDTNGNNKTMGQTVYSTTEGTVIGCGENKDNKKGADPANKGNWVRIQMNDGWNRDYYHLNSISVKTGDKIVVGDKIGYAGNTGASTGPHLHVDEYSSTKPSDYQTNPNNYLEKSYDGGNSYIYFRNPSDYK